MEGKLSFDAVRENYEFAEWELQELVEEGKVATSRDDDGSYWFDSAEILRYLRATPTHLFSFKVASYIYQRDEKTLRRQAKLGKIRAKKISYIWVTTASAMDLYMQRYSRNV